VDLSGQVLFTSKSLKRPAGQAPKDLPQAIRPAVEIIARLSAERARLRDDVERLQEELRRARATDASKLRAELESMRHERDELRTKVRELRRESTGRANRPSEGAPSAEMAELVARLERAVNRLEGSNPTLAPAPPRRSASPRPAPSRGGGMLAGLVKENAKLRETPRQPSAQRPAGGGGMLAGLVKQNAELRATPRKPMGKPTGQRPAGGGGMLAGLVKQNAELRATPRQPAPQRPVEPETRDEPAPVAAAEQAEQESAAIALVDEAIKPRKSFARSLAEAFGLGGRARADEAGSLPGERQAG